MEPAALESPVKKTLYGFYFLFYFFNKFIDHFYLVLNMFLRKVASVLHHHCVILPAFKLTLLKMW